MAIQGFVIVHKQELLKMNVMLPLQEVWVILPKVHNMDIQFAQSMVFTPCDFSFPANGIKAEATPNTEMILIADVDIDLLRELNQFGSVRNLKDRRKDIFELKKMVPISYKT